MYDTLGSPYYYMHPKVNGRGDMAFIAAAVAALTDMRPEHTDTAEISKILFYDRPRLHPVPSITLVDTPNFVHIHFSECYDYAERDKTTADLRDLLDNFESSHPRAQYLYKKESPT